MSKILPPVPSAQVGWALERIIAVAGRKGNSIYDIMFRSEGVGVMWHEPARQKPHTDFRAGLHCYGFHTDLGHCLSAELMRLVGERDNLSTGERA